MATEEFELKKHPSFLAGFLKGLASRLGGDDEPILLAAADYIKDQEECECPDGAELTCISVLCPRK